jgi:uncharacterized protein (DUF1501 family)
MILASAIAAGGVGAAALRRLQPFRGNAAAIRTNTHSFGAAAPTLSPTGDGLVVFVYLEGGNDMLNTIIPMAQYGRYVDLRTIAGTSSLAYAAPNTFSGTQVDDDAIEGDANIAFNPGLPGIAAMYRAGRVAVMPGIGCNPNYSHFTSQDQWWSVLGSAGSPLLDSAVGYSAGWMGRYAQAAGLNSFGTIGTWFQPLPVLRGNPDSLNLPPWGVPGVLDLSNPADARLAKALQNFDGTAASQLAGTWSNVEHASIADAPNIGTAYSLLADQDSYVSRQLKMAANLFNAGLGTRVVHCQASGYDTHANQRNDGSGPNGTGLDGHRNALQLVDTAIADFYARLQTNLHRNVTVVVYSEFGRRPAMNDTNGTDHGTAGAALVIGDNVRGGIYGDYPSLAAADLVGDNMKVTLDYRGLFATVISDWLGADPVQVINGTNPILPLFAAAPGVDPTVTTITTTSTTTTTTTTTTIAPVTTTPQTTTPETTLLTTTTLIAPTTTIAETTTVPVIPATTMEPATTVVVTSSTIAGATQTTVTTVAAVPSSVAPTAPTTSTTQPSAPTTIAPSTTAPATPSTTIVSAPTVATIATNVEPTTTTTTVVRSGVVETTSTTKAPIRLFPTPLPPASTGGPSEPITPIAPSVLVTPAVTPGSPINESQEAVKKNPPAQASTTTVPDELPAGSGAAAVSSPPTPSTTKAAPAPTVATVAIATPKVPATTTKPNVSGSISTKESARPKAVPPAPKPKSLALRTKTKRKAKAKK